MRAELYRPMFKKHRKASDGSITPIASQEPDGQTLKSRTNPGGGIMPDASTIFIASKITSVMCHALNRPMPPTQTQDLFGC